MVATTAPTSPLLHSDAFLHYEILGPRANLDEWLASLQDAGVCHLADALNDLEGEGGISRPAPTGEEVHAELIRSEASRSLRGIERVLPPTPSSERADRRPLWTIKPGGIDERAVLELKDEARDIAGKVRSALETVRLREEDADRLDAIRAAARLEGTDLPSCHVFRLTCSRRRTKRLVRKLERAGETARWTEGTRARVVVLPTGPKNASTVTDLAAVFGAEPVAISAELRALPAADAGGRIADELAQALRAEGDARAALTARVRERGERGRRLLDSLEDASRRMAARKTLAATEHVVAARVYVRPEDEPAMREAIRRRHGETVVVRPLADAGDEPSLPRKIAAVPLAALHGLGPRRFGDVSITSVLALLTPIAVGIAWADIAGGLLLLLAGAVLQHAAGKGSPRRDTALLAQVGGLMALGLGVLGGRAFGPAGEAWFGEAWGIVALPAVAGHLPSLMQPFARVLVVLGAFSLLLSLWGVAVALWTARQGQTARARTALVAALHYAVVAGLAASAIAPESALHALWILAPAAAVGVFLLAGPRGFFVRLCLDLVGVVRLVAVAGAALLAFQLVLAGWVAPSVLDFVIGPLVLLVAALAVVADPAHLAMGVPYDLALGGSRIGRSFEPFRRRMRRVGET